MIPENKQRVMITIRKTAWKVIKDLAGANEITASDLIEGIVMRTIIQDLEKHKKGE